MVIWRKLDKKRKDCIEVITWSERLLRFRFGASLLLRYLVMSQKHNANLFEAMHVLTPLVPGEWSLVRLCCFPELTAFYFIESEWCKKQNFNGTKYIVDLQVKSCKIKLTFKSRWKCCHIATFQIYLFSDFQKLADISGVICGKICEMISLRVQVCGLISEKQHFRTFRISGKQLFLLHKGRGWFPKMIKLRQFVKLLEHTVAGCLRRVLLFIIHCWNKNKAEVIWNKHCNNALAGCRLFISYPRMHGEGLGCVQSNLCGKHGSFCNKG